MKKLLGFLAVLVLIPSLASAGWVQRQNDDGTADWVSTTNSYGVPLAGGPLQVTIPVISTASTAVIVSPVTGTITHIYGVGEGATTGTQDVISIFVSDGTQRVFNSVPVTFAVSTHSTNTVFEQAITPGDVEVKGGAAVAIVTDGGSTGADGETQFVIIVSPK